MVEIHWRTSGDANLLYWAELFVVFVLLLIPTFLMGAAFPAGVAVYINKAAGLGKALGRLYAFNTVGAMLGSLFAGFLLIPWIGVKDSIVVAVIFNLLLGGALLVLYPPFKPMALLVGAAVAVSVLFLGTRQWERELLISAPYLHGRNIKSDSLAIGIDTKDVIRGGGKIIFYKEGLTATVSVRETRVDRSLQINGKTDASSRKDLTNQLLLAHLPLLLNKQRDDVLVIGLGSGITLGGAEQYPVKRIDVVETSPEVVEASGFFREYNNNSLADKRVNLIIGDGRNHLYLTKKRYDVIISEPSNVWISGMGNLFSLEYFGHVKRRLKRGGVMCQWLHAYRISGENFKTVIRTFSEEFPYVTLWLTPSGSKGDYLLIGSDEPIKIDYEFITARFENEKIKGDMERAGIPTPLSFLRAFMIGGADIKDYVSSGPVNTDDNLHLEFSTPMDIFIQDSNRIFEDVERKFSPISLLLINARGEEIGKFLQQRANEFFMAGNLESAILESEASVRAAQDIASFYYNLGLAYQNKDMLDKAIEAYEKAIELDSDYLRPRNNIASAYAAKGRHEDAIEELKEVIRLRPDAVTFYNMGLIYQGMGNMALAEDAYKKARAIDPGLEPPPIEPRGTNVAQ
jgi:spermidine synthase